MHIKIHIGTEKTGSSYLQSMTALGRQALEASSVIFPRGSAHDERSMAAGKISAGNSRLLAQALSTHDLAKLEQEISNLCSPVSNNAERTILLSSEWLLPSLAAPGRLYCLQEVLKAHGAFEVSFLVVLRDPVDQCLSLYKHRAKRGSAGDIAAWCDSGYHLPVQLAGFRKQAEALGADVTVQSYSRVPGLLESQFFEDWLGAPIPQVSLPKTVNPSLTLSELALLRQVAEIRLEVVDPLYEALLAIDLKNKFQGASLERYARAVATRAVAQHAEEWAAWNLYLPADGQLKIPAPVGQLPSPPDELGFSEAQMAALAKFLGRSATLGFLAQLSWRNHLRPALGRAKRAIWCPTV